MKRMMLMLSAALALGASADDPKDAPERVMTAEEYAEAYRAQRAERAASDRYGPIDRSPGAPGYGASGQILPYEDTPGLRENRERYGLTAGWFVRDPLPPDSAETKIIASFDARAVDKGDPPYPDRLPFLLFKPDANKAGGKPVPLVVFLPGNGELGDDLNRQFKQRGIFEKVTSSIGFQEQYPCYLLVISTPPQKQHDFGWLESGINTHRPSPILNLINDTILGVALAQQTPPVDTNRLYATGLSYGASALCGFGSAYPGRYAALVLTSSYPPSGETSVHPVHPGNWWIFYNANEGSEETREWRANACEKFKTRVTLQGGEVHVTTFPDSGHNAWDKAWRTGEMWEWMFSKTADGTEVPQRPRQVTPQHPPEFFW